MARKSRRYPAEFQRKIVGLVGSGSSPESLAEESQPWLQRQYDLYGRWPRQASFDGCFASKANVQCAKDQGIRDIAFAMKRGLKVQEMARSS